MRVTALSLLSIAVAGIAQASVLKRQSPGPHFGNPTVEDYFTKVCLPDNPNNRLQPNGDPPCEQMYLISYTCTYGSNATWEVISGAANATHYGLDVVPPYISPRDQQICVCESQYFNAMQGCLDCAEKHGVASALAPQVNPSVINSFSSSYCAVTNTPTVNFADIFQTTFQNSGYEIPAATATTWSDPIGNKTDVSLYYTPSVTGTAAYSFYEPGASSSGGSVTSSVPINTSNGQIVATARANTGTSTSGTSTTGATAATASTATKTGAAPMGTPPAKKLAAAGVLGLAAVVAAL